MSFESITDSPDYSVETETEMRERYSGFGLALFNKAFAVWPTLGTSCRFFRHADSEDVWAVCITENAEFVVQLDPDLEVIVLSDLDWYDQIGTWVGDPVQAALSRIRERWLPEDKTKGSED